MATLELYVLYTLSPLLFWLYRKGAVALVLEEVFLKWGSILSGKLVEKHSFPHTTQSYE